MGKADTLTKAYMQDTDVFADAFNYLIYGGEQVIHPEQLHELDTTSLATLFGENNENAQVQVYRDVLKSVTAMEDGEFAYLVLGIENQTGIHYAMPVRNMLYDALQYYSQVKTIAKKNRKELSLGKDEFFSGITKDDKLLPVITLVVYFGSKKWDGPKSLHEMLTNKDARALAYVEDYKIHLLEPAGMTDEDIAKLKSDLKDVFYFIKYSGDKDKLQELVESSEEFHSMKKSTAEMIKLVTNTEIKLPEGEERVDMCLAIRQMKEESEAIGMAKGEAIGMAKGEAIGMAKGEAIGMTKGEAIGMAKGEAIGEAKGGLRMLFELVRDGLLTLAQAAVKAKLTEEQFKVEMAKAGL